MCDADACHLVHVKCCVRRGVRLPEGPPNPAVRQLVLQVAQAAHALVRSNKGLACTGVTQIRALCTKTASSQTLLSSLCQTPSG